MAERRIQHAGLKAKRRINQVPRLTAAAASGSPRICWPSRLARPFVYQLSCLNTYADHPDGQRTRNDCILVLGYSKNLIDRPQFWFASYA